MYQLNKKEILFSKNGVDFLTSIPIDERNADYQRYLRWLADGNTPLPADAPIVDYSITPAETFIRVNTDAVITVAGAASEALTLYAYPVDVVPDVSRELDVTLDDTGRKSVMFRPGTIGLWVLRGKVGELMDVIATIQVVA